MVCRLASPTDARLDYDLLYEPWLPVLDLAGSPAEVSLLECLERAHELREVAEASPLVTFGLHRFLAAVLQTYLCLGSAPDPWVAWGDEWERGHFESELIERVREGCDGRLRLFDPTHPFYQTGDEPLPTPGGRRKAGNAKTVGYLYPEASTGTNVVHFSHPGNAAHAYCPVCCARGLVALPPFATAGGAGIKPSINGVPPLYILPEGRNLFQTLLLNYVLPQYRPNQAASKDPGPLWSHDGRVNAREERAEVGFVESLTWPPRRVRLFPEEGGVCSRCGRESPILVRQMTFAQGWSRPRGTPPWDDPWVAFREPREGARGRGDDTRSAIRPQEGRQAWRDFAALFLIDAGRPIEGKPAEATRPYVLRQIDSLRRREQLPWDFAPRFQVFGLRTDSKAKVFEWTQHLFDFPAALLDGEAAEPITRATRRAELAERALVDALLRLHPDARRERPRWQDIRKEMRGTTNRATRAYWQRLEERFGRAIHDPRLRGDADQQAAWERDWLEAVRRQTRQVFESALTAGGFDGDADALFAQVRARSSLEYALARIASSNRGDQQPDNTPEEE